jgi:hypothetical protein
MLHSTTGSQAAGGKIDPGRMTPPRPGRKAEIIQKKVGDTPHVPTLEIHGLSANLLSISLTVGETFSNLNCLQSSIS